MVDFYQFDSRWRQARGGWGTLPAPAQFIVGLFALPGILLAILSLVLFAVSMLALLVLTVPVYRLLARLSGGGRGKNGTAAVQMPVSPFSVVFGAPGEVAGEVPASGAKRVDSTVVD